MQVEALKVFCDIISHESFSQGAAVNHLSQSAASQIVRQLEKRLGARLIDRSRPLRLTELGQRYYDRCSSLVQQYLELEAEIRQAQARLEEHVRVAAIYSVGLGDMGEFVDRFRAQHPNVHVHLEYLHPDRVYERVLDKAADLGLVSFPRRSSELAALSWREEEMVLACAPSHRLARQPFVSPAELEGEKYIGFDRDLVIRREVDRFLRELGVAVEVTLEFDNIENIKKAVEVSAGVALLPEPTLRREVQAGTLIALPLQGGSLVRPLGIIQRRNRKLGPAATRFRDLLRQAGNADAGSRGSNGRVRPGRFRTRRSGSRSNRNGAARTVQPNS
jgi:DNA-binding transcriptional LysR family regulator